MKLVICLFVRTTAASLGLKREKMRCHAAL